MKPYRAIILPKLLVPSWGATLIYHWIPLGIPLSAVGHLGYHGKARAATGRFQEILPKLDANSNQVLLATPNSY